MPYRLVLDASRRLALMTFAGDVDGNEITRASAELVRTAGDGALDVVCDLSEVGSLDLAPGDLEDILSVKLEGPPSDADLRRDVVIARRELDRLLARFYALLGRRRGLDIRICRTRAEARQWLGVEALPDAPVMP